MEVERSDKFLSLEGLQDLSVSGLRTLYQEILQTPPPKYASVDFLRGNIAWAIQARQGNNDPARLRTKLQQRAAVPRSRTSHHCKPGTRLVREWQGETHEVTILEKGYHWRGAHYRSLSRIAHEITGTRWSGPRFFGLGVNTGE